MSWDLSSSHRREPDARHCRSRASEGVAKRDKSDQGTSTRPGVSDSGVGEAFTLRAPQRAGRAQG